MDHGRVDPPHTHTDPHGVGDGHHHGHNPHLAHHFDTMEQQYDSGKLGMWVFLATELLMFGGLFCAYSVYRSNHPEVFLYAHHYLNTTWGAINTAILLASSLTMAWAVRCSQLGQQKALVTLLLVTLLGGAGFMMIKAVEYNHKFHEDLGPGYLNQYNVKFKGNEEFPGKANPEGVKQELAIEKKLAPTPLPRVGIASTPDKPFLYEDPNAASADKALITPHYIAGAGLTASQTVATTEEHAAGHEGKGEHAGEGPTEADYVEMGTPLSRQRVNTFFGIYYCMTGLHGIHVLVGMGLIFWVAHRAATTKGKAWIPPLPVIGIGLYLIFIGAISHHSAFYISSIPFLAIGGLWLAVRVMGAARLAPEAVVPGEFSQDFFAPVDLVGLYWHLVDLIWIFLFPLLYLIHGKVGS